MKVIGITEKGAEVVRDAKLEFFEAGTVVLALGLECDTGLMNLLKGKRIKIYCIGDCLESRKIAQAMDEGFLAAARA